MNFKQNFFGIELPLFAWQRWRFYVLAVVALGSWGLWVTPTTARTAAQANIQFVRASLVAEYCNPTLNSAIDPGEQVTVNFMLRNVGTINTTNLVATLQSDDSVTALSGAQNYGVLSADGAEVTRGFTFIAQGACGANFTVTLALQDGANALGNVSFGFTFGTLTSTTATFSNSTQINIPATDTSGVGSPYPSGISVNGLTGEVVKVTATLNELTHTYPGDVDVLLVGPGGQSVILMSDAGGGYRVNGANLTFDDAVTDSLKSFVIVSGTYKPTNFNFNNEVDTFPLPAPGEPYGTALSVFNNVNPNGTWNLYVVDDTGQDIGYFVGGWALNITTNNPTCCNNNYNPGALQFSAAAYSVNENGGAATLTVTRNNDGAGMVTVDYATSDGTATAGSDYAATSGKLTWLNGETSKTFSVPVSYDFAAEPNETINLTLSNPAGGAVLGPLNTAVLTIVNARRTCPASFTVNDLGDGNDAVPGDGVCATATGLCTLRAALQDANVYPPCTPLMINFNVTGTITLSQGELFITHPNLIINGPGANLIAINANQQSRVLELAAGAVADITDLTFTNGKVAGTFESGGGILNGGTLTLRQCAVTGNQCLLGNGGGIVSELNQTLNLFGCTIANNTATQAAGVSMAGGVLNVVNSTISGNIATNGAGGGLADTFAAPLQFNLVNSTVTGNSATGPGGGVELDSTAHQLRIKNSIITGNTAPTGPNIANYGVVTSLGNNLFGSISTFALGTFTGHPSDLNNVNPLLGPLASHGGSTQTHALLPGSPALNKGDNCVLSNTCVGLSLNTSLTTDQRGVARVGNVDSGAFESRGFTLAAIGSGQSAEVNANFVQPLAITVSSNASPAEPVNGGLITFTPPASGASAVLTGSPAVISGGVARVEARANLIAGAYSVLAASPGLTTTIFNLTNTCPALGTLPASLPNGTGGTAYNSSVATSPRGDYVYSVGSGFPNGLSLNPSTGAITGIPAATGTFNFTITATRYDTCSVSRSYTVTISCPTLVDLLPKPTGLNNAAAFALTAATLNQSYSTTINVTPVGGNPQFIVIAAPNQLPAGLSLVPDVNNANQVRIAGTPTVTGSFVFRIQATAFGTCVGSRLYSLKVNAPSALAAKANQADFDGDGKSDLWSYRAADGRWLIQRSSDMALTTAQLGSAAETAVPADYDGDGKTDVAVFNVAAQRWQVIQSRDGMAREAQFGAAEANPYPADYDGDGKADLAVREAAGNWLIHRSTDGESLSFALGAAEDQAVIGDFDGDGITDAAVYRPAKNHLLIRQSGDNSMQVVKLTLSGEPDAKPCAADFDGDGKVELALWSNADAKLVFQRSSDQQHQTLAISGDILWLGDYDGDGRGDCVTWQAGRWLMRLSSQAWADAR